MFEIIKDELDQWEWDHAHEVRPGGLLPTDAAVEALAKALEPVWEGRPHPVISAVWDGGMRVMWEDGDRGCIVSADRDGTLTYTSHMIALGTRHEAPIEAEKLPEVIDWVLAAKPNGVPAVKTVKGYGPLVLDAVVDKVLPWWARPIVKGPVIGGIRFVAKQVAKIDPASIDRFGAKIKGKVQVCRDYWRNLDAKP